MGFDHEPQWFYNKKTNDKLLAFFHNDHIAILKDMFCQYELKNWANRVQRRLLQMAQVHIAC